MEGKGMIQGGMENAQRSGQQSQLPPGKGFGCAISQVSQDRASQLGHLHADLVVTAGAQIDFHKAFAGADLKIGRASCRERV